MPGLRPNKPDPDEDQDGFSFDLQYFTMGRSDKEGAPVIYAMTFEQIIDFLTRMETKIDDDDSILLRFNQIKAILKRCMDGQ